MKIDTALVLCAGLGKRLSPLTLTTPKPLLELNGISILERCINTIMRIGIKKIFLNTFHLSDQISEFIKNKKFQADIQIIKESTEILNTGGGILNMIKNSKEDNFMIFNPDTLWNENYVSEINNMETFYFQKKLDNILLVSQKKLSFDQNLKGDFKLTNNLLKKDDDNSYIYIGCQILNRSLFKKYNLSSFPISEIWNELLINENLNGFESFNKFLHVTNLETFKKLKDF